MATGSLYPSLSKSAEDRVLSDAEKDELWAKLSNITSKPLKTTIYGLMQEHRLCYPRRTKTTTVQPFPYDMVQVGPDLHVFVEKLPNKLISILDEYMKRIELLREEESSGIVTD